jgi:XTP/dITP diphosphohydrolase
MTIYAAATTNPGKLREFAECARGAGMTVLALPGLREMPEPVEDAATFMGNAELKAAAYSRLAPGMLVMADDSGLEVDALGGAPGVRSARFAEDYEAGVTHPVAGGTKDDRNNALLLHLLARPDATRAARYVCALVVAREGEVLWRAEAVCDGEILDAPRGDGGFGYDPLFLVPQFGRSMAELSSEEKWSVSHRGKAFRALLTVAMQIPPSATLRVRNDK